MLKLSEKKWFKQQQPLLLWMANTSCGRDLLRIPKWYPKIVKIEPHALTAFLGFNKDKAEFLSDFRCSPKWTYSIQGRWKDFQEYAQFYYRQSWKPILFPIAPVPGFAFTTTTVYPNSDPETTTMDAGVGRGGVDQTFANIRTGAGNSSGSGTAGVSSKQHCAYLEGSTTSNQYAELDRGIYLFDTSSIPDTDTINSGTFSVYLDAKTNDLGLTDAHAALSLVDSSPASNTSVVDSDYGNVGTTKQATDVVYSSMTAGAYNGLTLNATGLASISKTGVTKFGTRFAVDADAGSPAWASGGVTKYLIFIAENTPADPSDTSQDPKLAVVHSGAASVHNLGTLGVGA